MPDREIAKAAYNDRNSKYGWDVDHIFPLTKGGKTAEYNLICCRILTNGEKTDIFPCFKVNTKEFEKSGRITMRLSQGMLTTGMKWMKSVTFWT